MGGRDAPANCWRAVFAVRDGGVLLISAEVPRMTQRRVGQPVVAALARVAAVASGLRAPVER